MIVETAPAGAKPKWSGFLPRLLQYEVSRKVREIILSSEEYPYLNPNSKEKLQMIRESNRSILTGTEPIIFADGQDTIIYTYAGGYVNFTLRFALMHELKVEIVTSNEFIKFKKGSVKVEEVVELFHKLKDPSYWEADELRSNLAKNFPNYRISKFQQYLPDKYSKEILGQILLDVVATLRYLNEVL